MKRPIYTDCRWFHSSSFGNECISPAVHGVLDDPEFLSGDKHVFSRWARGYGDCGIDGKHFEPQRTWWRRITMALLGGKP